MDKLSPKDHDLRYRRQLDYERQRARLNKYLGPKERFRFGYLKVEAEDVPGFVRGAAQEVLKFCASRLKLNDLSIEWIKAIDGCFVEIHNLLTRRSLTFESPFPITGRSESAPGVIQIRYDLPLREIQYTIAHEAHHAWFKRTHGKEYPYSLEEEMWENSADAFALIALQELRELKDSDILQLWGAGLR